MTSFKRQRLSEEAEIPETEEYEVFLSFRGPDTRQGFTDVLYDCMDRAGIRVFRDDDELAIGDRIDKILLALNNSQICVPIFSKTFAESKWCLREVSKMVELSKDVVPVFYNVTPDDVALKTPAYREFIAKHENRSAKNIVDKWEADLKDVAKLKGREVLSTSYTKFCKAFVEELLIKLKPRKRYDLDNLVGMDNQVDSTMKLLDIGAGGVRYILIHGMGGIGKTTLAKVMFDKVSASFNGCSFMENIRESSKREGLDNLQKKLGESLDPKPAAASNICKDIRERFRGKKVLIILDDVDAAEQVEELVGKSSFASESRIIITTRNANVLNECEHLDEGSSVQSLEMGTLQYDEALQLFKIYAFRKDSPPPIFEDLSKEAISTAGGLPLAIKVIASLLRGKSERVWRDVIARSKKIPQKAVKERLKISYDALEEEQKRIFLDIACFFIDTEISYANYMWEARDLHPTYGLEVLMSMSLLKITEWNAVWMHDQVRDLGRDIVREENRSDPMKRSRIWLPEDAVKVLQGKRGGEKVEALSLRQPLKVSLTREQCAGFRNLRFLELKGVQLEGDYEDLWTELKWLSWCRCPSDFKVNHSFSENLVILNLSHSPIDENWGGWSPLIQTAIHLKVLDLTCCRNLTRTPDFSRNRSLERLILYKCINLAEIGISVGNLRRLKFLDLRDCENLTHTPDFSRNNSLERLLLSGCKKLAEIGISIGQLSLLEELNLRSCYQLQQLPELPPSLRKLGLSGSGIRSLPSTVDQLSLLEELYLTDCSQLQQLPELPPSLRKLGLSRSGIHSLPSTVDQLFLLEELDLRDCSQLQQLPELPPSLRKLVLSGSGIRSLPSTVDQLSLLKELYLTDCSQLQQLPELPPSLRKLVLSGSGIRSLPSTVDQLSLLEELYLTDCSQLQQLPELPPSLRKLGLSRSGIHSLPSTVDQLSLLEELYLTDCSQLQQLPELPPSLRKLGLSRSGIHSLPSTVDQLSLLEELYLRDCSQLQQLPELPPRLRKLVLSDSGIRSLPSTVDRLSLLEELDLRSCRQLQQLPGLPPSLRKLVLSCSGIHSLPSTVDQLSLLEELDFGDCSQLQQLPELPPRLRKLVLSWSGIRSLPSTVDRLSLLEELDLRSCHQLQQLPGLPPSLRKLVLSCSGIHSLPSTLDQLSLLEELDLRGCHQLQQLPELPPSLRKLVLSGSGIHSLPSTFDQVSLLEELDLRSCHQLQLQSFTNLKKLVLKFSNHATTKLMFLSSLTKLESLSLGFEPLTLAPSYLRRLSGDILEVELPRLSNLKNLSDVYFHNLSMEDGGLVDNLGVEELESLETVVIHNCSSKLIEAMCLAKSLRDLTLRNCGSLERLGNLSKLKKLSTLHLRDCPALTCIEGVEEEGFFLERLNIRSCGSLQNVDALLRRSKYGEHDGRRYTNGIEVEWRYR